MLGTYDIHTMGGKEVINPQLSFVCLIDLSTLREKDNWLGIESGGGGDSDLQRTESIRVQQSRRY